MKTISKEYKYILEHLQNFAGTENAIKPNPSVHTNTNFDRIYKLGSLHQVISILHVSASSLKDSNAILPRFAKKLNAHYFAAAFLAQKKSEELKNTMTLLSTYGIEAIPWRGPIYGDKYYGDINNRNFGDLDFIIRKKDFLKIKQVLLSVGYERYYAEEDEENTLKEQHALAFKKIENNMVYELDMHWSTAEIDWGIECPDEDVWARTNQYHFKGKDIRVLHPEDLLMCICIHHGVRNYWLKLKFICDLTLFIKHHENIDWKSIMRRAKKLGVKQALLTGCYISKYLLKINLPKDLKKQIEFNPRVALAGQIIMRQMFAGNKNLNSKTQSRKTRIENIIISFFIKPSRSRFIAFIVPNELDKKTMRLPTKLHFLYYFIRPFRLLNEFGKHLF